MKPLKLEDCNHFLKYGGKEEITVVKLKVLHSPHVKEHDWEFVETIGLGNQYKHQCLDIFGHVIQGDDLKKLAADLLQSRLLINREGYCYLESEIVPSSFSPASDLSFNKIEYYRINDLFGWHKYQVKPKITMVWNRCEIERGHIIISLEGDKGTVVNGGNKDAPKAGKDDNNNKDNSDDNSKVKEKYEKRLQDLLVQMNVLQRKLDKLLDTSKNNNTTSSTQPQITTTALPPTPPPPPPLPKKGRYTFETEDYNKIFRYCRDDKPSQFIFQIESFGELKKSLAEAQCYEFQSPEFDAFNQQWTLSIYLEGHPNANVKDHISLYLKRQPHKLKRATDLKLLLRFFIYSYTYQEYLVVQELIFKEFDDQVSLEAGIAETLKKKDFEKFENGFVTLKTKKCTFGIEMFQIESKPTTTNLSLIKNLYSHWHSCTFDSFSKLEQKDGSSQSDEFQIGDYYWMVEIYPKGRGDEQRKSFSVFLVLANKSINSISNGEHLFVDFELLLKEKNSGKSYSKPRVAWFTQSEYTQGHEDFISLDDFEKSGNYKKDNSVTIEVNIKKMFKLAKK